VNPKKPFKLWERAKEIIPGGTQLLSKRPEMFLPDQWPAYYSKAKGVEVWDIDGNKFIDMSMSGIGACILGYAEPDAELLYELHPWANMVRFARTGGEAVAIVIRIARAYTSKDKIAFCGYHGWHDWYLSANLAADGETPSRLSENYSFM